MACHGVLLLHGVAADLANHIFVVRVALYVDAVGIDMEVENLALAVVMKRHDILAIGKASHRARDTVCVPVPFCDSIIRGGTVWFHLFFHQKFHYFGKLIIKVNRNSVSAEHSKKVLTEDERYDEEYQHFVGKFMELQDNNPAIFWLMLLSIFSVPLYVLFLKSPNIPDLRFSELVVALVYTYDMMLIYQMVIGFFRLPTELFHCTLLLPIIPMKQLSGFPWWRSILNVLLAYMATYYILMWGVDGIASLYAKIMLL